MTRSALALLVVLIVASGCNLARPDASATATPPAIPTWEVRDVTLAACVPRTDWPVYTVQSRDNLTVIANATGSTIDELAEANCLRNRNRLDRGQTLHVPRLPGQAAGGGPAAPVTDSGDAPGATGCDMALVAAAAEGVNPVTITPARAYQSGCYTLSAASAVTVGWPDAPATATEVTFYRVSAGMTGVDVLGIDSTAADGFRVRWSPRPGMAPSAVYARVSGGASQAESAAVGVVLDG
ncbi:MAG: LysM peptidoglycan-binding domain-containing protein [Chloroflexota bacterium]